MPESRRAAPLAVLAVVLVFLLALGLSLVACLQFAGNSLAFGATSRADQSVGESVAMIGPYPEMALEYAVKLLKKQYGPESVIHWRVSNTIAVCIAPVGEDSPVSVALTIEQAKFLTANPMSPQDLADERYLEQWPR